MFSNTQDQVFARHIRQYNDGEPVHVIGRVLSYRKMGGVAFGHISDNSDTKIQFAFNKKMMDEANFKEWSAIPHIGDIVAVTGEVWTTSTGEKTVLVNKGFQRLQKASVGFPDKWHGMTDPELVRRKRWLECATDPESRKLFRNRSKIISIIRSYLEEQQFMEVETPILTPQASGAQARPFITHHNALDADFYLRIAPETYLKRMTVAGFDRVFEIGKQFRNEGIDPSHLQEFTSLEWYAAYWDYCDNMKLFRNMLYYLWKSTWSRFDDIGDLPRSKLDTWAQAPVVEYRQLFKEHTGCNPDDMSAKEADQLFKTAVRPKLIDPVFVTDYPAHMSPMAARHPNDPNTVQQWQFIVEGWEVVKCYTELTDPVLQRQLLEQQMQERANGDDEAMMIEEDYLECMEHGMPPQSGCGVGIDRLISLLFGVPNLRDVVFFPTLKSNT
jgi:lysyl-tRNA synthetase class 2